MGNMYDSYLPTAKDIADKANPKRFAGKTKSSKQAAKELAEKKAREAAMLALASGVPTELREKYLKGTELTQNPFKKL